MLITTEADLDAALAAHDPDLRVDGTNEMTFTAPKLLDYPCTLTGGRYRVQDGSAFVVTSPDVTIDAARITGGRGTDPTYSANQKLIHVAGTQAAPLANVTVRDCVLVDSRGDNVWLSWTRRAQVIGCQIRDYLYSGVLAVSSVRAIVQNNTIGGARLTAGVANVYGIAFTDLDNTETARSRDCTAVGNMLFDIEWEALDTHGGDGISFVGNTITGCSRGIAFVTGNASRLAAPTRALASGNLVNGASANPPRNGIWLSGIPGTPADGTITGNHITGYPVNAEFGGLTYVARDKLLVANNNVPLARWAPIDMSGADFNPNGTYTPRYMIDGNTVTVMGMMIPKNAARKVMGRLTNPHAWPEKLSFLGESHGSNAGAGRCVIGVWGADSTLYEPGTIQAFYPDSPWTDAYSYPVYGSYQAF